MTVHLRQQGCNRRIAGDAHTYTWYAEENGWSGTYEDNVSVPDGVYQLPDDAFSEDSGWAKWECDDCGITQWQLSRPGGQVTCGCGAVTRVPVGAVLAEYKGAY